VERLERQKRQEPPTARYTDEADTRATATRAARPLATVTHENADPPGHHRAADRGTTTNREIGDRDEAVDAEKKSSAADGRTRNQLADGHAAQSRIRDRNEQTPDAVSG